MKPHRVKHIPTGLYYKPYGNNSNLSAVGKVYLNNSDPFNVNNGDDSIYIAIRRFHSILKKFPNEFPELKFNELGYKYSGLIPKSKFEIEYLE